MVCLIFASIGLQEQLSTKAAEQQARVQVTARRRIPPCITRSLHRDVPIPTDDTGTRGRAAVASPHSVACGHPRTLAHLGVSLQVHWWVIGIMASHLKL